MHSPDNSLSLGGNFLKLNDRFVWPSLRIQIALLQDMSLLLRNIKTLAGIRLADVKHVAGTDMAELPAIENAFLLIKGDKIDRFGPMSECPERADETIDCTGKTVLPSWVDSHTHLVYAAPRESEFEDRIRGLSYEQIATRGGGILNSAKKLRDASEDQLFADAWQRLQEVISMGTGAIEIKSGYGLTVESELKMLRVIQRLKAESPIPVKATFLGAHAYPAEYKEDHEGYLRLLIDEMLPRIAHEGLADYIDAFCESNYFSPEETDHLLEAGTKHGLKAKVHINQFTSIGGLQTCLKHGALSVDHLEEMTDQDIDDLTRSETYPVVLPGCSFFIRIPYAPARKMIDAGLPLVIATDHNPGSATSANMLFNISLACVKMGLLPNEAINATTINGAAALELSDTVGSITEGKLANLIITKEIPSIGFLPYSVANPVLDQVIVRGQVYPTPIN